MSGASTCVETIAAGAWYPSARRMVRIHLTLPGAPSAAKLRAHHRDALTGELVGGVEALVARLELELGIPPPLSHTARILGLVRKMRAMGSSAPLADAVATMRLADSLRAECVESAMLPARWRGSLEVAMAIVGSLAERVERIVARLRHVSRVPTVVAYASRARWPGVIQRLLCALENRGGSVSWVPEANATPCTPTVELVRGRTGSEIAESVVEALRRGAHDDVVWVAPEHLVDYALASRGMPLCGVGADGHPARGLLGRLVALACAPQDPNDALDVLTAPCVPIETHVSRRLCEALQAWPSWRTAEWDEACRAFDDEAGQGPPGVAWFRACLEPLASCGEAIPLAPLRQRVMGLSAVVRETSSAHHVEVDALCARFAAMLDAWAEPTADRSMIDGFVALAEDELAAPAVGAAQVGALTVPALSSVLSTVERLVVWNAASSPRDPLAVLLPSERASMRAAGATIQDTATLVSWWHQDLRRAIATTRERVWLCLPDEDARGARFDPPSWLAHLDAWLDAGSGPRSATHVRPSHSIARAPSPRGRHTWSVPALRIGARSRESPSSAMTALGCPLRHTLRYRARLGEPFAPTLPEGGLLYGRLAHALFDDVWRRVAGVPDPTTIAARLAERFDDEVPRRALSLELPTARARRAAVRETVVRSGEVLARALRESAAYIAGCEVPLGDRRRLGGSSWYGRADLVVGPTPMVLDLKWSSAMHRASLAHGTAIQLALYAWMLRGRDDTDADPPWPTVGYLVATTASLLSTPAGPLHPAETVAGPPLSETVAAVGRQLTGLSEARERGELRAPGVLPQNVRAGLHEGTLTVEPPCHTCAYGALCGRSVSP